MQFQELTTERLVLRRLKPDDNEALTVLRSDDSVNKYIQRPKTTTPQETNEFIDKINQRIANNEVFYWAITLKDNDQLIGTTCFFNITEDRATAEMGYELSPNFQGKGLMQEVLKRIIDFGFQTAGFQIIDAYVSPDNERSISVLEKNNFRYNKTTEVNKQGDKPTDFAVYSLLKPIH